MRFAKCLNQSIQNCTEIPEDSAKGVTLALASPPGRKVSPPDSDICRPGSTKNSQNVASGTIIK